MGGTEAFRSLRKWNTLLAGHVVNFLMCMNMRMKFIGRSFMSDQGKHLKRKKKLTLLVRHGNRPEISEQNSLRDAII